MKIKNKTSEKKFGLFLSLISLILYFYFYFNNYNHYIFLFIAFFLILISFIYPKLLKYLNMGWFHIGLLLGKIISPIVISLIYFTVFTLVRLIMILLGKKTLENTFDPKLDSYWVSRKDPPNSMERQF